MTTIVSLILGLLNSDMLSAYFFAKVLGCKYSIKITVLGTLAIWIYDCCLKLLPQYLVGWEIAPILSVFMIGSSVFHVMMFFGSSIGKRLLALVTTIIIQSSMDMVGLKIASLITGKHEIYQLESDFTVIAVLCSFVSIQLGTFIIIWLWKAIEQKVFRIGKYQWLCIFFPLSQYVMLWNMSYMYALKGQSIPFIALIGFVLGLIADIYMLFLFERMNQKKHAEKEMKELEYLYDLEMIRYEQLQKSQEEMAKIKHDFHNYKLTIEQLE